MQLKANENDAYVQYLWAVYIFHHCSNMSFLAFSLVKCLVQYSCNS